MNIITVARRWTLACGLCPDESHLPAWRTTGKHLVFQLMGLFSIIPQIVYIHHNRDDFLLIVPAIYSTFLFTGQFSQYLALKRNRSALIRFIRRLGEYSAELIAQYDSEPVERVEHVITRYLTVFYRLSFASSVFYIVAPGILQYQAFVTDTVTNITYEAPFHDMYYFIDTTETPLFEIFYVLYSLSVVVIVIMYLSKNFLFFGVCLYMVALHDELKEQLRQLDDGQATVGQRKRQILHCIRMHKRIIEFINDGNVIFNNVIMLQFVHSLFTLATLVFAATCVEMARVVVFFLNAVCLFGELFLFCVTGTLVLSQAAHLNETVYNLRWYDFTPAEKRLFIIMMMRNQRPNGFSAFSYFKCNLETFQFIVSKVFSAFTCLRSMA